MYFQILSTHQREILLSMQMFKIQKTFLSRLQLSQDRSLLPVRQELLPGKYGNDPMFCTQSPKLVGRKYWQKEMYSCSIPKILFQFAIQPVAFKSTEADKLLINYAHCILISNSSYQIFDPFWGLLMSMLLMKVFQYFFSFCHHFKLHLYCALLGTKH